jgi:hypothetical protein
MNSKKVSELFPSGTVIVAYKGKTLGGTGNMPQWQIEPVINENRFFRPSEGVLAKVAISNSISLEFEALNPEHLTKTESTGFQSDFDPSPGELTFVPLDPENQVAYYFPKAELKCKSNKKESKTIRWKFEILFDNNGVFMEKFKTS